MVAVVAGEQKGDIAIIGAGPAGLVTAKFLLDQGFEPVLFEQSEDLGGQWNSRAAHSGIWPAMCTNTSRVMSYFTDLPQAPELPVYPGNQQMLAYLRRYAETFALSPRIRLHTRVERVDRAPSDRGWAVTSVSNRGLSRTETFGRVVIASGRFTKPVVPRVPGVESFSGSAGLIHAAGYKAPERYRGVRVLVAGCGISALEIASDLAMLGAARVVTTSRRQHYVVQKLLGGVPADIVLYTRFAALMEEVCPPVEVARALKAFVLRASGSPEQFGARKPHPDLLEAGITQCQHYLPLVAEGRITTRPWIDHIRGKTVRFLDGVEEAFDGIIMGTGYDPDLSLLGDRICRALNTDAGRLHLYQFTFHPNLSGLAFVGFFDLMGPIFPLLELQARLVAYLWGGVIPAPSAETMLAGIASDTGGRPRVLPMHVVAIRLSRAVGVEPDVRRWPNLARALWFGPLSSMSFRLDGPGSLPDAGERYAEDAAAFGADASPALTSEQRAQLSALATMRSDHKLMDFVTQLPV
jgi:cation diffusion facilitator CzcD-associated flavoprotein CzcO